MMKGDWVVSPLQQEFIRHFGEMGSHWGINRTVGQIYALLYIAPKALNAEELSELLTISRSNVSMSIRELSSWHLIRNKHFPGDRKEYYTVPDDIWVIIRTLISERKKREIDPTLTLLRNMLIDYHEAPDQEQQQSLAKIKEMHDVIELLVNWYDEVHALDSAKLISLLKLGSSVIKIIEGAEKLAIFKKDKTQEKPQ